MSEAPALVVLTLAGMATAQRLKSVLPGAVLHGREGRVSGADLTFAETTEHLRQLFAEGRPIVAICAAGIVIRALAPLLTDKRGEPPVLAVSEDGSAVVPLLGGHRGGNALAQRIAEGLGGVAAITTAGDIAFGLALDEPPPGWRLANPEDAKAFSAGLLAGEKLRLEGKADWITASDLPIDDEGSLAIAITTERASGSERRLVYHPAQLAVGVGCERGCSPAEVRDLVRSCLAEAGLAEAAVAGIFSIDLKADEPALHAIAEDLGVQARFYAAERLEEERERLQNPSETVFQEVGCHGVAEGAALAAAGAEGRLLVPKRKSARATCAIAQASDIIEIENAGRPQGRLSIVGIGPGDDEWRTPEATAALQAAEDLVGYRLYLDLLGDLASGRVRHDFDLGEEEARVRHALDLAVEGRRVALVSSGDPGIYAMATLVFELLGREARADWRRVHISVVPGISAIQAAAARAGAPIGHDFCTISLSDLLTPWETIEKRVLAAAEGDFVVAFYNPVSQRRREQLNRAVAILKRHRPGDTPVVLAERLGRPGESLRRLRLDQLSDEGIDMMTLVLVGSSQTRRLALGDKAWIYTPRGYEVKKGEPVGEFD